MNQIKTKLSLLFLPISLLSCTGTKPAAPLQTETPLPPPVISTAPGEEVVPPPNLEVEAIYIGQPGPNSTLVSSFQITGQAGPTFEQNLVVRIAGLNGLLVILQPTTIQADIGQAGPFSLGGIFNIAAVTPGRISVYDVSARDGGLIHLASVQITLMPGGSPEFSAPPPNSEVIAILEPEHLQEISGGVIQISGFSEYFFEGNLSTILCGAGGIGAEHLICGTLDNILAEGFATIISDDIGIPGPFLAELLYSVGTTTRARLVVYALSPMDGGIIHLSSREITLNP